MRWQKLTTTSNDELTPSWWQKSALWTLTKLFGEESMIEANLRNAIPTLANLIQMKKKEDPRFLEPPKGFDFRLEEKSKKGTLIWDYSLKYLAFRITYRSSESYSYTWSCCTSQRQEHPDEMHADIVKKVKATDLYKSAFKNKTK